MAASDASAQSGYIQHHLVHLNNSGVKQDVLADFSIINYDSVFWSLLTGFLTLYFLLRASRRATPGVPGRFQVAVEMLVERSEEHTSELQSRGHLVCRLLLEKKKKKIRKHDNATRCDNPST